MTIYIFPPYFTGVLIPMILKFPKPNLRSFQPAEAVKFTNHSSTFCEVDSLSKGAFVKVRIDALDLEEDKLKLSMHPPGRVAATGSDWYSANVSKVNRGGKDGVCGNSLYTPTNRDNDLWPYDGISDNDG